MIDAHLGRAALALAVVLCFAGLVLTAPAALNAVASARALGF